MKFKASSSDKDYAEAINLDNVFMVRYYGNKPVKSIVLFHSAIEDDYVVVTGDLAEYIWRGIGELNEVIPK